MTQYKMTIRKKYNIRDEICTSIFNGNYSLSSIENLRLDLGSSVVLSDESVEIIKILMKISTTKANIKT